MKKKYSNGVYEGEGTLFTKKRHGKGKMTYTNGDVYEGEWKDDKRCGMGELYRKKIVGTSYSYKGEWSNDKLNGHGTYTDNYTTYEGEFKNGEYDGQGTLTKKSNGVVIYTYTGSFSMGKKSGQGKEKCKDYTYNGSFFSDMIHGSGKKELPNKDYYNGQFAYGQFQFGTVKKTEETGDVYTGSYNRNCYDGRGQLKMTDGTVYSGDFKMGQLHGIITVTKPDGTKVKEKYENGVLQADDKVEKKEKKTTKDSNEKTTKAPKKTTKETNDKTSSQEKKTSSKATKKSDEVKKASAKTTQSSTNAEPTKKKKSTAKTPKVKKAPAPIKMPSPPKETLEALDIRMNKVTKALKESVKKANLARENASELENKILTKYVGYTPARILNKTTQQYDTYRGGSSLNKCDGWGIYEWYEGDKYVGEWVMDVRSGLGTYRFPSGNVYRGHFLDNKKHGSGVMTYKDNTSYIGDFLHDNCHGYGKEDFSSGDAYEGEYKNNKRDGCGTYVWSKISDNPGEKYVGEWKDNYRHGFGIYYCSNGDVLTGYWTNGQLNGKTFGEFANGDKYEGEYKNDSKNGQGTYVWKSGDAYSGEWKKGTMEGYGIYYQANGNIYEGEWKNNKREGRGTIYFPDGGKIEGNFVDNKLTGDCVLFNADGRETTGKFENGSFVPDNVSDGEGINNTSITYDSNLNSESTEKSQATEEKKMFTPVTGGGITFDDVAGLSEVKDEIINHVIEPLRNPELASIFGVKPGGKILLYGPPGTGKTYIARAIAGEIDAAFYSVSCQDLISKWLGESSERINKLFDEAQEHDKAIIFFDEFDSVASKRDSEFDSPAMARFLATFLTKVDGFTPIENKMLLLIAATNRPWALDPAILRGGRFDKQIYISLPDKDARDFLVNKALGSLPLDDDLNLSALSDSLEGFGGSDIVSICEKIRFEAYKKSVKSKQIEKITLEDCKNAMKGVQNHISQKELEKFEEYRKGIINN